MTPVLLLAFLAVGGGICWLRGTKGPKVTHTPCEDNLSTQEAVTMGLTCKPDADTSSHSGALPWSLRTELGVVTDH